MVTSGYDIQVVNKHHGETGIYIGRGSPLGNPFVIGPEFTRDEAIKLYEEWLNVQIQINDPRICDELNRIVELTGQGPVKLQCFCSPKPCHGDVIRRTILNALEKEKQEMEQQEPVKYYAGIGSRKTPDNIRLQMYQIAKFLDKKGYTLRSGHADGADKAFEGGSTKSEIFIPWERFNGSDLKVHPHHKVPEWSEDMVQLASEIHPAWNNLSEGARKLHTRNIPQVLGEHFNAWVEFIICWTPEGKPIGGTGQALRLAERCNIPVFNLATETGQEELYQFFTKKWEING